MFGRKKRKKPDFIETVISKSSVVPISDSAQGLDFLVSFFSVVRPSSEKGKGNAARNLADCTHALRQHPVLVSNLRHAILSLLIRTDLSATLTESGIPLARGFWQEFFGRLRHKLLPPLQSEHDFLYVLNRVFFRSNDYLWVESIPRETWIDFFGHLGLSIHMDDNRILWQLLQSLKTLAFQVAQLGLEKDVLNYISLGPEEENPFVEQNYRIHELEALLHKTPLAEEVSPVAVLSAKIKEILSRCYTCIDFIREQYSERGASLHQTYILIILANRLDRIYILIDLLDHDKNFDTGKFVDFFRVLVRNENRKNSIREFMSQSMGYLAYQIAEHKGSKGSKYITSTWAEYRAMLKSAMGGGAWVCLVVFIKNMLTRLSMPVFWHGFAYSVNYSVGFLLIEETHTTLATKQPAFTASAVAGSLDTRKNEQPNLYGLAVTVAKVSRSQIASFAGNLIIVFPGAWLIAWAYEKIAGSNIVSGAAAAKMLQDQHPWKSLSLLYACNTGFFLFLSGIIAGYVQNKIRFGHIPERLQTHPILRLSLSQNRLKRLGDYVEKHAGAIIGNIALGFFLGMAGFIGEIFGIRFDIRHITISAGNVAIATYGLGWQHINHWYLLTVLGGVLGIGLLNFLVSFSLAFFVAVRSRGIRLRNYPAFLGILWRYFRKSPLDFIRPRRRPPDAE
jgi:site-specific recombinase